VGESCIGVGPSVQERAEGGTAAGQGKELVGMIHERTNPNPNPNPKP